MSALVCVLDRDRVTDSESKKPGKLEFVAVMLIAIGAVVVALPVMFVQHGLSKLVGRRSWIDKVYEDLDVPQGGHVPQLPDDVLEKWR